MIELATVPAVIEGLSKVTNLAKEVQGFLKQFETKKKRIFVKHIEPAFDGLQPVLRSYADIIAAFRRDISDTNDYRGFAKALGIYTEERRKTVQRRSEVIAALDAAVDYLTKNLSERKAPDLYGRLLEFLENLRSYFVANAFEFDRTRRQFAVREDDFAKPLSAAGNLQEAAERHLARLKRGEDGSVDHLVSLCDEAIKTLEKRSYLLHRSFAALKLKCTEG
jgi:hypothetical protein